MEMDGFIKEFLWHYTPYKDHFNWWRVDCIIKRDGDYIEIYGQEQEERIFEKTKYKNKVGIERLKEVVIGILIDMRIL